MNLTEYKEPTEEELQKIYEETKSHVDYEVGDWVETCNFLPGIVQVIDIEDDTVEVFYPHYAFREDCKGAYCGGSSCSICHCGVHKITPEYACKLMAVGEDNLKALWEEMCKDYESDEDLAPCWEDYVEKRYNELYTEDLRRK